MSILNFVTGTMKCPRCGYESCVVVELRFGFGTLVSYQIGDRCRWAKHKRVKEGGRPEGGNMIGEGYVECEKCGKDYFVNVLVKSDVFVGLEYNMDKDPFVK